MSNTTILPAYCIALCPISSSSYKPSLEQSVRASCCNTHLCEYHHHGGSGKQVLPHLRLVTDAGGGGGGSGGGSR